MTQYEPGTYHPGPHSEWNCQLLQSTPAAKGKSGKIIKLDDLYNLPEGVVQKFQSGKSVLKISGAKVTSGASIKVPRGAAATIKETKVPPRNGHRDNIFAAGASNLQAPSVDKKVLVVRVKTATSSTTSSVDELSNNVFFDEHNLSTQFDACSYGKLTFSPLRQLNPGDPPLNAIGVYEVEVTKDTSHEGLRVRQGKPCFDLSICRAF